MPRQARLDVPGLLHHVIARGIEGRDVFGVNKERDDFLERLAELASEKGGPTLYATGRSHVAVLRALDRAEHGKEEGPEH